MTNPERPTQTSTPSGDWSRTPAAMVCALVLGSASVLGLGWSIKIQATQFDQSHDQPQAASDHQPIREPIKLLIDLNSANPSTLELLPSIGPKIAERIIQDRTLNGPYESIEDLDRVSGIGPKTIDRLQDWVMVSPP